MALLDMIDAIDADMHARASDAELTPSCSSTLRHRTFAAEFRSIMRDSPAAHQIVLRPSGTSRDTLWLDRAYMRALQELDPPRGSQTLRRVSSWKSSPTSNMSIWTPVPQCSASCCWSLVHTAAQDADSPQHQAAGWRFIDWNEVGAA